MSALRVEAITGKPYKPTTQSKNERIHQTLFRYLDKQEFADTLDQLQAQVDAFDIIYNTQRPHQALHGRITPLAAWEATPKAEPPRPKPRPVSFTKPPARRPRTQPAPRSLTIGAISRSLNSIGTFRLDGVTYMVSGHYRYETVTIIADGDRVIVADLQGEVLVEHTRPAASVTCVGNGRPKGRWRGHSAPSPMSSYTKCHRSAGAELSPKSRGITPARGAGW